MIRKIISGGQTGADRAALDFAIRRNIPHGWLPKGRKTEDGPLNAKYQLREMPTGEYARRTEQNVLDADGTVIVSHGRLTGGSALTRKLAGRHEKPWLHLDLEELACDEAAARLASWIGTHKVKTLNVAGPKAGKDPAIYEATLRLLGRTFTEDKA